MGGIAISSNNGKSFKRHSRSSMFHTSDKEPFQIMTAPFVYKEKKVGRFGMCHVKNGKIVNTQSII